MSTQPRPEGYLSSLETALPTGHEIERFCL